MWLICTCVVGWVEKFYKLEKQNYNVALQNSVLSSYSKSKIFYGIVFKNIRIIPIFFTFIIKWFKGCVEKIGN